MKRLKDAETVQEVRQILSDHLAIREGKPEASSQAIFIKWFLE